MKMPAPPAKSAAGMIDPDVYAATIVLCAPVMDPANPTIPLLNDSGKYMVNLRFQLDDEKDDEGNPVVLYRSKMGVSYGQYAGKWADYAALIEAALGIPAGDKAQHNVDTDELTGKRLRVQTANAPATDGSGKVYTNVVGYFKSKAKAAPVAAPAPVAPKTSAEKLGLEDADLADLPF